MLRHWHDHDHAPFAAINADAQVMRYFPTTMSAKESSTLIAKASQQILDHGFSYWAAELKATQKLIGFIGLQYYEAGLPFAPCVDIGWRLARSVWGQGLATEGAQAALVYGFTKLQLDEIISMTVVGNRASERVMQKIGMTKEDSHFIHPGLPKDHSLAEHVLYKISQQQCLS